jgi:hypothetical protein
MESTLLGARNYQGALFPMHAVLPGVAGAFRALAYAVSNGGTKISPGKRAKRPRGRALCIADTFARLIGMLTDQAVLLRLHFARPPAEPE